MRAILLPGLDGGADLLRPFQGALGPDVAGEIFSYPPDQVIGYDGLEASARARLAASSAPTALVAESFSGPVAIRIGACPPANLTCIVLVATFVRSPAPRAMAPFARPIMFRGPPPAFVIRRLMLGRDAEDEDVQRVQGAIRRVDAAVLAARLREVLATDVTEEAAAVTLPVLYLRPSQDRLVGRPLALPGPNWERMDFEGPHLILQRRPLDCAARVSEFIRAHT